ncbi:MAG TPA: DUF2461 domain-containing protein [Fibrobacteria bacterium]|nr:DUF2461 domain-containing protein [Fibrobacteria bacterium]
MLTQKTFAFLADLKKHNDRGWFLAHKPAYLEAKAEFEGLVGGLIHRIAAFDKTVQGLDPRKCAFRIFRDARFSKDKSPYKTHFGAHIGAAENKFQERAGYYLHVEPGNCFLGGGAYMPSSPWLKAIRNAIAEDGKFFRRLIAAPAFKKQFGTMQGETLKKAPQGFPADHPYIDLLRHKNFLAMRKLKDAEVLAPGFAKEAAAAFKALQPFERFLNDVLEDL